MCRWSVWERSAQCASSLEGAEQKVQQLEEADAASAEGAQPLSIIADCLMMIVAWLFYFIKIEWFDEREESGVHAAKKHRAINPVRITEPAHSAIPRTIGAAPKMSGAVAAPSSG